VGKATTILNLQSSTCLAGPRVFFDREAERVMIFCGVFSAMAGLQSGVHIGTAKTTPGEISDKSYRAVYPPELRGITLGDTRNKLKRAFPGLDQYDEYTPKAFSRFIIFQFRLSHAVGDWSPRDSDRIEGIDCVIETWTNWKLIAKSEQKLLGSNFKMYAARPPSNIESYRGIFSTDLLKPRFRVYIDPGLLKFSEPDNPPVSALKSPGTS